MAAKRTGSLVELTTTKSGGFLYRRLAAGMTPANYHLLFRGLTWHGSPCLAYTAGGYYARKDGSCLILLDYGMAYAQERDMAEFLDQTI